MDAVVRKDPVPLTRAEGVGSKLANRLILELKNKTWGAMLSQTSSIAMENTAHHDAIQALIQLGYAYVDVASVVRRLVKEQNSLTTEELIKKSLLHLSQGTQRI